MIKFQEGTTPEPNASHFSADQTEYNKIHGGKSIPNLLSERPEGLHKSAPIVESIEMTSSDGVEKSYRLKDFLPPHLRELFDENGYLINPNDPFWIKTSCFQTAALIGIYSTSPEEILNYDIQKKGTIELLKDATTVINPKDAKYRDVILLKNGFGGIVHACNFVIRTDTDEVIVITKDGVGPTTPIKLQLLSRVMETYKEMNPNLTAEYRREINS